MEKICVLGPISGLYYLGYYAGSEKFLVINEFLNGSLALALADKMNADRLRSQNLGENHGR